MHAIRDGRITPTERDPFDPTDFLQGPSMYTVTELPGRERWQHVGGVLTFRGRVSSGSLEHVEVDQFVPRPC